MKFSELNRDQREALFRRALSKGDINLHYQPFVNTEKEIVTGFEALARWETEEHGKVSPGEFLPLVEECDLIDDFCAYSLQQACKDATAWQSIAPNARLSVNVSTAQFLSDAFVPAVEKAISRTGMAVQNLDLELTEATLIKDPVITEERLEGLENLGANIAIDDFGSGYSSLGGLKTAPFDRVKIDRSFINGLAHDHVDQSIVKAIVNLCAAMKLYVTAVGVETPVQEDILSELGCHEMQGFLYARPMPISDAVDFVRKMNAAHWATKKIA